MRVGPKRSRYTRAEYIRRKREEEERAAAAQDLRGAGRLRQNALALHALFEEHRTVAAAMDAELNHGRKNLNALSSEVEQRAEEVRVQGASATARARRNVAELAELEKRTAAVDRRRIEVDAKIQRAEAAERRAKSMQQANERKEQELDAGIAAIEAMSAGLLEEQLVEGTPPRLTAAKAAGEHPKWMGLLVRMNRAPDAAARSGGWCQPVSVRSAVRRRSRSRTGPPEAHLELALGLAAVRKAAELIAAIYAFARQLIDQMPPSARTLAGAELERLAKDAAKNTSFSGDAAASAAAATRTRHPPGGTLREEVVTSPVCGTHQFAIIAAPRLTIKALGTEQLLPELVFPVAKTFPPTESSGSNFASRSKTRTSSGL